MRLSQFSLGGTAAIITSMGLIAGLSYADNPKASIVGGLLIIAVADNISDSFGIHMYKESECSDRREVFITTVGNFLVRLLITLSFVLMVLVLPPAILIWSSPLWGLLLLTAISYNIARLRHSSPVREVMIHLVVAVTVIAASGYAGHVIASRLG